MRTKFDRNEETEEEFLACEGFCDKNDIEEDKILYSWVFSDSVEKMTKVAKELRKRLKVRKKLLDEPG